MRQDQETKILFESKLNWTGILISILTLIILTLLLPKYYWIYGVIVSVAYFLIALFRTKKILITKDRLVVAFPYLPNGRNYFIRLDKIKSITYVDHAVSKSDRTHINVHKIDNLKPSRLELYLGDTEYARFEKVVKGLGIGFRYTQRSEDIPK